MEYHNNILFRKIGKQANKQMKNNQELFHETRTNLLQFLKNNLHFTPNK